MRTFFSIVATLLLGLSIFGQQEMPKGASNFIDDLGGLIDGPGKMDLLQQIAGNKIDKIEYGGGAIDSTKVDGRIFVRRSWMIEIGEINNEYNTYDLEKGLSAELEKRLVSEGFVLTPSKFNFGYVRYQKGSTVGTLEVRSFFLGNGNVPLRIEFIFNESFRSPKTKRRPKH